MALANRLKWYMDSHGIEYEVTHHEHSSSSLDSGRRTPRCRGSRPASSMASWACSPRALASTAVEPVAKVAKSAHWAFRRSTSDKPHVSERR